ncbi:MAG TPA: hemin uptake protein HemP [Devosiaceae bacterium]|jgi:hemin uptake protein HemP
MSERTTATPQAPAQSASPRPRTVLQGPRRFNTAELFGEATEVEIEHEDALYRLKITRQGKLILNK